MRIGIAVDYGRYANASSLHLIARKVFSELGKIMNQTKSFTISALKYEDIGVGDVNQHFDAISVPNMGGYRFPKSGILTSNNSYIGIVGIDEVILGRQVFKSEEEWKLNKPIIEREVPKWTKNIGKIKFVHVSTDSEKEDVIKYLKIPESKLRVIPLGVDHHKFKPVENKEEIRKALGKNFQLNSSYFIHVSETNYARKNILRILEAFEKARNEGIKQDLIIVGRTEPIIFKKAKGIPGVIFTGYLSDEHLVNYIQGAYAMIYPSLHEGFGLPALEAMSCGIPVIAANVFSSPEVVGDGGLFVNPYNTEDITKKIIEISRNQNLRENLAQSALKKSMEYSWERTSRMILNLIQENTEIHTNDFDFEEAYDLAAYRTITTVCEIIPELMSITRQDLLEADYSRIIHWARETGLEHPSVKDFLIPFKEWLDSYPKKLRISMKK